MNLHGSTISFPFQADVRGSILTTAQRHELIGQAIADVLGTRQGERVMLPDYGIPDFVFAVMDAGFAARLSFHFGEQIEKYVPLVERVQVKTETDENGRAVVSVRYFERGAINAPQNLVFPVWQFFGGQE